jgi:hypothetical protein
MPRYRKKPVEINAVQWLGNNLTEVIETVERNVHPIPHGRLQIKTLEGTMTAEQGDFIIKGVQGEVYPCKPDIFRQTYEPIDT